MESIYLRTLVEVARTGSITRAAEVLAVTQSAASRRIRFVEEQYGKPLLDRSGPALTLTPAGAVVVEMAQKILQVERELETALEVMRRKTPGITVVCTPTFGIVHLPEILREFMVEQGEVRDLRVVLELPERIVAGLKSGEYDLAVIEHCRCVDLPDFETTALVGDELLFAAAPSLGIEGGEVNVDRILAHPLFTRSEGCCSTLLRDNLATLGRSMDGFRRVVAYDDLHVILRAVIRGEGIAFASTDFLTPHVRAGRLRTHRVRGFQHVRARTLVRANGTGDPHVDALCRQLVTRIGRASPEQAALCS